MFCVTDMLLVQWCMSWWKENQPRELEKQGFLLWMHTRVWPHVGGTNLTSRAGADPENGQKVSLLACVANSETHIKIQFPEIALWGGIFHNVSLSTVKQQLTWKH